MKYRSVVLCPDSVAGYQALHEHIQDGWEPLVCWQEGGTATPMNHILLRIKSKARKAKPKAKREEFEETKP